MKLKYRSRSKLIYTIQNEQINGAKNIAEAPWLQIGSTYQVWNLVSIAATHLPFWHLNTKLIERRKQMLVDGEINTRCTLFIKIELEPIPDSINKRREAERQGAIIGDIVPLAANFQTLNLSKNLLL